MPLLISTRGRYALRVVVDLALHSLGAYIPLKQVAERQSLSKKYIEGIIGSLSKAGIVESMQGRSGGCRLALEPSDITVKDVLALTEGSLAPVACVSDGESLCSNEHCPARTMWSRLDSMIDGFLSGITIADLMKDDHGDDIDGREENSLP